MTERVWLGVVLLALGVFTHSASSQSPAAPPPDERTLRLIIVESIDEAQRIRARLIDGESFELLASQLSIDPSAERGGLLGRLPLSALRPELRNAVQALAVGGVSDVVPLPTGFGLVKIVPDAEARDAALGESSNRAVSAVGSVKPTLDVSGFAMAVIALDEHHKPDDWNHSPLTICEARTQSLAAAETDLARDVLRARQPGTSLPPYDRIQLHYALGQLYAYQGRMDKAIEQFQAARDDAAANAPDLIQQLEQALGVAHLHRAGMENGVFHAPGDRCLLSPGGFARLERTADAVKAVDHFARALARRSDDLEGRWLLNLAEMASGGYPDRVPASQRLPQSMFASAEPVGRFLDVAPRAGLASVASAGGVIVDDFDNDGRFEIVTTDSTSCGPMRLFHRRGGGPFVDRATQAGLRDQLGGLNLLQADYDNDGFLDILVLRGGWDTAQRKSLLRNNGDGTFVDVTAASGLARPATSTQTAVWSDVNNDGFVDLFVGNEDSPSQLFINQKNGTFADTARAAGVNRTAFTKGVAAGDYDDDGWPDLYVSNLGGVNFLYRNNGDGTFSDVGRATGVTGPGQAFATWFFDCDNDGRLDIFVNGYFKSVDEVVRSTLRLPINAGTQKLYRNLGGGAFADVTRQAGLDRVYMPMGANFGDIDNDGFLDVYLGSGNPSYASIVGSVLLRNQGGRAFVDVTAASGTGELHKGHGVAFADLDNDGDEEIVFEVGGATPGDAHALRLFENPGTGQDWINLKLVGTRSNRAAIGARIAVTASYPDGRRQTFHRTVGSGGSFGASPLQQHVGLGKPAAIDAIEIWWPTSDTRQRFTGISANQTIRIVESETAYTSLERPLEAIGGGSTGGSSEP